MTIEEIQAKKEKAEKEIKDILMLLQADVRPCNIILEAGTSDAGNFWFNIILHL